MISHFIELLFNMQLWLVLFLITIAFTIIFRFTRLPSHDMYLFVCTLFIIGYFILNHGSFNLPNLSDLKSPSIKTIFLYIVVTIIATKVAYGIPFLNSFSLPALLQGILIFRFTLELYNINGFNLSLIENQHPSFGVYLLVLLIYALSVVISFSIGMIVEYSSNFLSSFIKLFIFKVQSLIPLVAPLLFYFSYYKLGLAV
jgi:hypothetical protein